MIYKNRYIYLHAYIYIYLCVCLLVINYCKRVYHVAYQKKKNNQLLSIYYQVL